jgi:hypothetical protein
MFSIQPLSSADDRALAIMDFIVTLFSAHIILGCCGEATALVSINAQLTTPRDVSSLCYLNKKAEKQPIYDTQRL